VGLLPQAKGSSDHPPGRPMPNQGITVHVRTGKGPGPEAIAQVGHSKKQATLAKSCHARTIAHPDKELSPSINTGPPAGPKTGTPDDKNRHTHNRTKTLINEGCIKVIAQ